MKTAINTVISGDCLEVLRTLPDNTFHCCVTSPPYWRLRDYGINGQLGLEKTPEEYVSRLVEVFREVRRVLRDDGTLWLNLGDSYATKFNGGNGRKSGTGANRNIDKLEKPARKIPTGLKPKDLVGIPWRVAFALQGMTVIPAASIAQWADWLKEARLFGDWEMVQLVEERLRRYAWVEALQKIGWYLRSDIIWNKPNAMPESVKDRPTKAHEYIFLLSKSPKYYYDADAIREPHTSKPWGKGLNGSIGKADRGWLGQNAQEKSGWWQAGRAGNHPKGRNKRTVWNVSTKPFKGAHFAVFPPDLIKPCILAGCPEGGIVLDPFFGSGTTGLVARELNRGYIGIELNPEYIEIARERLGIWWSN